ncbi:hypothetical protein LOZ53_006827 [Ophidiomyces ophidiicola]|nr:hypothetical protein LOZ55_004925 [Ophidiomyces ophidiicola]KAI1978803.1 hypothetical protein LOZ53_006827 [Ophidiomyces ophidiicola]KAI1986727.1 hypothetical protein LOZ54_003781 [Ophidiomyces ophidiicola]KAI1996966.1 hypothetical protein LOZ51_003128 [Ophidiomyces ophidiicola]
MKALATTGHAVTTAQKPRHWHDGVEPLKFIRGTCTDKTWKSPKCQGHCVQENPSGGEWVMRCGQNATKYCCSAEDCCMRNDYIKIELDRPTVTATAGIFLSASTSLTIAPSSSEISPSSSFQTPTSSPSVFPTPISDPSKDRRSLGLRVGVGVGVAIGVLLVLGALALWKFFQNRRKRKDEPEEVIEHGPSGETSDQYRNAGGIIQELPSKQQRSELE